MSQHKEQQGYLTVARNTDTVDYLNLAYVQALNVKATQRINSFAVVVDAATNQLITDQHRQVFDYIIVSEFSGPFEAEPLLFWLTPFRETIKLESDLLFTISIDHWWTAFRLRDVCLSTGCRNYRQELSDNRKYRKLFDDNHLPDVYNGLMYFRLSQTAQEFFLNARKVYDNWPQVTQSLLNCEDTEPSTDVVFAIAALLTGVEQCTAPSLDFINFVHMKPAINGFPEDMTFDQAFVTEFESGMIRVNNVNQYHPVHYYNKNFITSEIKEYYERLR
jgi:hypothetical protein